LLQALGQSLTLSGIVFTGVLNMRLENALTFGAMLQMARLMGGEIGTAGIATFQRMREQRASNLIGLHLRVGNDAVLHRLQAYGRVVARGGHADDRGLAAASLLARVVRSLATTQSVIDGFAAIGASILIALFALAMLPPPPRGPASPMLPVFRKDGAAS
jgi:DHA2 family multidrug resistance protein